MSPTEFRNPCHPLWLSEFNAAPYRLQLRDMLAAMRPQEKVDAINAGQLWAARAGWTNTWNYLDGLLQGYMMGERDTVKAFGGCPMTRVTLTALWHGFRCELEAIDRAGAGFVVVTGYDHQMVAVVGWVADSAVLGMELEIVPGECTDDEDTEAVVMFDEREVA